MLRPIWHVTLRLTVCEIFTVKIWDFGPLEGTASEMGDFLSGANIFHHAKFHADRYHRSRDICNWTDGKKEKKERKQERKRERKKELQRKSDKSHTSFAFMDKKFQNMFSSFETVHERDRHPDGWTDRHTDTARLHRTHLCISRGKNWSTEWLA